MVFRAPSWVAPLPELPNNITIEQFMHNDQYGRYPMAESRIPYVCGITGKSYTVEQIVQRVDYLSRAIKKRLLFDFNEGTEWDRVVGLFCLNTIDYIPFTHAVHRLSGIVSPASAAYSVAELEYQLRTSGARALFTCMPLLDTALKAAKNVGITRENIFLIDVPETKNDPSFVTLDDLVQEGSHLPPVPALNWIKGQGERQTAYLCFSSGTSGLPKAVMISHLNVIANIIQFRNQDQPGRTAQNVVTQVSLGVLPFSHIYALTLVTQAAQYRGDSVIVLPRFDFGIFLNSIQRFKINQLYVVPPMLIAMISNPGAVAKFDLSSVRSVFSGAAPLGPETIDDILKMFPKWNVCQGYGMTEASPVVTNTSEIDQVKGSSGSLISGMLGKIIDAEGKEVTGYEQRGELLVQGPNVTLGYLNNQKANSETYVIHEDGRWLRTGDEVLIRVAESGSEHLFVVDRIKELIKTKGHQVAPAELEAHILAHEYVADCAVIPVPDDRAGEVPKAFVVKSSAASGKSDEDIAKAISQDVERVKARYKWLKGGVEFIDAIPKSPSGKILRRLLRDKEKQARKAAGAKL